MANESSQPSPIRLLLKKEAEAAVALGVNVASFNGEALRYGRFHLRDGTGRVSINVGGRAVDAVHDEGAVVHSGFRAFYEAFVVCPPGPGGVDVGVGVEY